MNLEKELRHLKYAIAGVFALLVFGGVWKAVTEDKGGSARQFVNDMDVSLSKMKTSQTEKTQACKDAEKKLFELSGRYTKTLELYTRGLDEHDESLVLGKQVNEAIAETKRICQG